MPHIEIVILNGSCKDSNNGNTLSVVDYHQVISPECIYYMPPLQRAQVQFHLCQADVYLKANSKLGLVHKFFILHGFIVVFTLRTKSGVCLYMRRDFFFFCVCVCLPMRCLW